MAEITDTLKLDIDQALRDVQRIEQALDRALAPVELRIDDSSIQNVESSLRGVQSVVDDTTDSVRLTADEYREVARAIELGVDPAQAIARATGEVREQANLAEADFRDVAQALDISEDAARDLAREILDAQQASQRLEDSARDVARQLGLSDSEAREFTNSLQRADRAADNINVTSGAMLGTFGNLRTAAAGIAGVFAAIGIGNLFSVAARGANAAVQEFAQFEDSVNAINVLFGDAADTVLRFGENSAAAAGLSARSVQQLVGPIGALLTNFGFSQREAAEASVILVQRAADLASLLGGDVQDALLAINSALVGQVEPLRKYGGEISQARVEQFALAQGLIKTKDEMTTAVAVQARYGLILADTAKAAGDFANTSDDFANAQRSAQAAVQNLQKDLGEALIPAFEALLEQAPAVLDFFNSLIPALAQTATDASAAGAGLATLVSTVALGFGQLFETVGAAGDVLQTIPAIFDDIAAAADGDLGFASTNAQIDQFNQRRANTFIRIASQSIPQAISEGRTAIDAFGDAILFLGRQDDSLNTIQQSFDRLSRVAGLSGEDLAFVTEQLIIQAPQFGLNSYEVNFLTQQLTILRSELGGLAGNEVAQAAAAMAGLGEDLPIAASRFTTFTGELETARVTITQTLRGLADDSEGQQERLTEALDPFADLPEQIELSAAEATEAIVAQFEAIAAFEANIIRLADEAPLLAARLFEQGPEAADLVRRFLDAPALVEESENALRGVATAAVTALTEGLEDELVAAGLDQSTAAKFAAIFSNPNIIQEVTDAGIRTGASGVGGYRQGLLDEMAAVELDARTAVSGSVSAIFAQEQITEEAGTTTAESFFDSIVNFDPLGKLEALFGDLGIEVDLTDEGTEAGLSLMFGMQEAIASRTDAIGDAVENATRNALQMQSPSRLMLELGREAADSFATGFEQINLQLRTPAQPITGSIATAVTGQAVAGGNVQLIINNPTVNDAVSDAARLGQIASSIATTYRSVT